MADRLRRRDRSESQRLFRRLREAQGAQAGEEAFEDLREFVAERNGAAGLILSERREEILTVHRLNLPSTLNVTLLSTNIIENVFRNWREQTGNVKSWSVKADMIDRWSASGLLWAESGFRRIRHYEDLPKLKEALQTPVSDGASSASTSLREPDTLPSPSETEQDTCKRSTQRHNPTADRHSVLTIAGTSPSSALPRSVSMINVLPLGNLWFEPQVRSRGRRLRRRDIHITAWLRGRTR